MWWPLYLMLVRPRCLANVLGNEKCSEIVDLEMIVLLYLSPNSIQKSQPYIYASSAWAKLDQSLDSLGRNTSQGTPCIVTRAHTNSHLFWIALFLLRFIGMARMLIICGLRQADMWRVHWRACVRNVSLSDTEKQWLRTAKQRRFCLTLPYSKQLSNSQSWYTWYSFSSADRLQWICFLWKEHIRMING